MAREPITGRRSPPTTFDQLQQLLQAEYARLTPSQQRLASQVLSDPEGSAFMTVTEMAQTVRVNEATVVRFAGALGLNGYPALSRLCRERLQAQAQMLSRFRTVEYLTLSGRDPLVGVAGLDRVNLERTFARIAREDWERAVEALAAAPRVHVIGLRKCFAVAYLLSYLLGLVRAEVWQLSLGAGTLTDELRRVRPGDAFVAISIHRYTRDTVRALRRARGQGARTLVLTDTPASPLASLGDLCFYVDTGGVAILRSLTAFVSLTQALVTAVATRLGAETRSSLAEEEELLEDFDVYEHGPDASSTPPA